MRGDPSDGPSVPASSGAHLPIVAVGASAGGLEAFSQLLEHLPPDTGMAFVLIQHLAPTHKTILPEILSRRTTMPVVLAERRAGTAARPRLRDPAGL